MQAAAALDPPPLSGPAANSIPYCPHLPHPKQAEFLALEEEEAFYGGAGGGGKSDALLMAALKYINVPGYNAMILRRSLVDLRQPSALQARAEEWLRGTDAHWNGKLWRFPAGTTLSFGYLRHEKDKYQYRSAEWQYIAFDELTQFTSTQYAFLRTRTRRLLGSVVPIRVRSASNPGGEGHDWVYDYFVNPETRKKGVGYVHAEIADNPSLDVEGYMATLRDMETLDPVTAAQMATGDWTLRPEGGMFKTEWFNTPLIDEGMIPKDGVRWLRYWDYAATVPKEGEKRSWTVGMLHGYHARSSTYYIRDVVRTQGTPGDVDDVMISTAKLDGINIEQWVEEQPGAAGKALSEHQIKRVFRHYNCRVHKPSGDKVVRANPVASQMKAGNYRIVKAPWTRKLVNEFIGFPQGDQDQVDACSGAHAVHRIYPPAQRVHIEREQTRPDMREM